MINEAVKDSNEAEIKRLQSENCSLQRKVTELETFANDLALRFKEFGKRAIESECIPGDKIKSVTGRPLVQ